MMGLQLIFFLIGFALLHMGHIRNGGVHFCFAVRLDGTLIGEAVLYRFDYRGGAELGCRIDTAHAGHGYGTEAFAAVADWALYKVHLTRVVAKCYKENQASYKMLSSCMRRSGEDGTVYYFDKLV